MGIKTKIEYADSTVNPIVGCAGCELYSHDPKKNHCYAAAMVRRWAGKKGWPSSFTEPAYFPQRLEKAIRWPDLTGTSRPDKPWLNGLPRIIFVNDLGDGFAPNVWPHRWLEPYIEDMAHSPHVYLLLTKWPDIMRCFFYNRPIPENFGLGTTVPNQDHIWRVKPLLDIKGGFKWLSLEPMLGPIDLTGSEWWDWCYKYDFYKVVYPDAGPPLDWVIVGGESGPGARPMHPDWARGIRDQCQAAGVPFFFKQWGAWKKIQFDKHGRGDVLVSPRRGIIDRLPDPFLDDASRDDFKRTEAMARVGKKTAGRLLDGKEHSEMPNLKRAVL